MNSIININEIPRYIGLYQGRILFLHSLLYHLGDQPVRLLIFSINRIVPQIHNGKLQNNAIVFYHMGCRCFGNGVVAIGLQLGIFEGLFTI